MNETRSKHSRGDAAAVAEAVGVLGVPDAVFPVVEAAEVVAVLVGVDVVVEARRLHDREPVLLRDRSVPAEAEVP